MKIVGDINLAKRENEVLKLLAKGCPCNQIAKELLISEEAFEKYFLQAGQGQ